MTYTQTIDRLRAHWISLFGKYDTEVLKGGIPVSPLGSAIRLTDFVKGVIARCEIDLGFNWASQTSKTALDDAAKALGIMQSLIKTTAVNLGRDQAIQFWFNAWRAMTWVDIAYGQLEVRKANNEEITSRAAESLLRLPTEVLAAVTKAVTSALWKSFKTPLVIGGIGLLGYFLLKDG